MKHIPSMTVYALIVLGINDCPYWLVVWPICLNFILCFLLVPLYASTRTPSKGTCGLCQTGSNDLSLHEVELSGNYRCQQIELNSYPDSPLFISMGFLPRASLMRLITKPHLRQLDQTHLKLLQMSGDVHPNPGPATKYPCPVCTHNVTSRGVSYKCTRCSVWVHVKCSGILNAVQYQ